MTIHGCCKMTTYEYCKIGLMTKNVFVAFLKFLKMEELVYFPCDKRYAKCDKNKVKFLGDGTVSVFFPTKGKSYIGNIVPCDDGDFDKAEKRHANGLLGVDGETTDDDGEDQEKESQVLSSCRKNGRKKTPAVAAANEVLKKCLSSRKAVSRVDFLK